MSETPNYYTNAHNQKIHILPPESNINNAQGVELHILPQVEVKAPHHVS